MSAESHRRRACVTGMGVVSPIGTDLASFWASSLAARTGTRLLDFAWLEGRDFRTKVGAPVVGFDLAAFGYTERDVRMLDRVSQFALAATSAALGQAGLATRRQEGKSTSFVVDGVDPTRVAVVLGTGMGGLASLEAGHDHYLRVGGPAGSHYLRFALPMCIPNAASAQVAMRHGFHGENKTITTACAAGTMAIGDACRLIWSGSADVVIAGGSEATLSDHDGLGLMGFDVLHCMSTSHDAPERASRPFHARRDGFVLGEGAGIVVLEAEEHARARGAKLLAEVAAYEAGCDAFSMLQPDPGGSQIARILRLALRSAGLDLRDVSYLNAHGTATPVGDRVETAAVRAAFGKHADDVHVSATKSMTGHAIAASGAMEAIHCVLAMQHSIVPPTANLDQVDPDCELNHVAGAPVERQVEVAMSPSYGFGGHDAVLVFRAA